MRSVRSPGLDGVVPARDRCKIEERLELPALPRNVTTLLPRADRSAKECDKLCSHASLVRNVASCIPYRGKVIHHTQLSELGASPSNV